MNFIKKKGCWVSKKQNYLMQGIVFASRLYRRISTTLEIFAKFSFIDTACHHERGIYFESLLRNE